MSDPIADDPDLLAAEYVLGVLDDAERAAARMRINADEGFARAVSVWERRLVPLSALADDTQPPADLWSRVLATTTSAGAAPVVLLSPTPTRPFIWQMGTAAGFAIAAGLAAFILLSSPGPTEIAVLSPVNGGPALLAVTGGPAGGLTIRPVAALRPIAGDRDLELWALPEGAKTPRPLGVLPVAGRHLDVTPALGTRILVSLEPKGGSPTGLPTGPIVYSGQMEKI